MIFVVVLACIGPFFIDGPDGEPLMSLEDLMPTTPDIPDLAPAEPVTVYKWQDENGIWQFSTEPVEGIESETMELDGAVTVMDAIDPRELRRLAGDEETKSTAMSLPGGLTTVAPDQLEQMMDTVNNLQETVDDRKSDLDKQIGNP